MRHCSVSNSPRPETWLAGIKRLLSIGFLQKGKFNLSIIVVFQQHLEALNRIRSSLCKALYTHSVRDSLWFQRAEKLNRQGEKENRGPEKGSGLFKITLLTQQVSGKARMRTHVLNATPLLCLLDYTGMGHLVRLLEGSSLSKHLLIRSRLVSCPVFKQH